jgi:hypothetical protein
LRSLTLTSTDYFFRDKEDGFSPAVLPKLEHLCLSLDFTGVDPSVLLRSSGLRVFEWHLHNFRWCVSGAPLPGQPGWGEMQHGITFGSREAAFVEQLAREHPSLEKIRVKLALGDRFQHFYPSTGRRRPIHSVLPLLEKDEAREVQVYPWDRLEQLRQKLPAYAAGKVEWDEPDVSREAYAALMDELMVPEVGEDDG